MKREPGDPGHKKDLKEEVWDRETTNSVKINQGPGTHEIHEKRIRAWNTTYTGKGN